MIVKIMLKENNSKTITLGNTTITAQEIDVVEVEFSSEPRRYWATVQLSYPTITENGVVMHEYKRKTYECTEEEYKHYLYELTEIKW